MSSSSSINISSGKANRSDNDMEGPLLPQDRNQSEMETTEDLRRKFQMLEKKHLELINQYNQDMSCYEKEIMKLRLALRRREAFHRVLESEIFFARREAHVQMSSAEDELCDAKAKLLELQVLNDKYQQKAAEAEKMFQSAQWQWEEEQQRYLTEMEFLIKEKAQTERACQETNAVLQNTLRKLRDMEGELHGCSEILRLRTDRLDVKNRQKERLDSELEVAKVKIKKLEENAEAARLAHMEYKYIIKIMQLRIQELECALNEEQDSRREAVPVAAKKDFKESENAHEGGEVSSNVQWREGAEERKETEEPSGRLVDAATSFSLNESSVRELSILLSIFQSMADGHMIARHPDVPLELLPWREFCELLRENVESLILNFHKANKRISHLEYICKHKTDTMNNLQQNQEDAFVKMSGQLKAQEDCWQKEKQYLENQYSNLLAEVHARAQEWEETAQKSRQKVYGLEKICEKLAHENNSVRNALSHAHKERSSLLAACALLSGALCPLYNRLCAMSSQRDILQDQANFHELVNQKIRTLLYALPTNMESNKDEERLRQRRAKQLIYVFRRAVIAVLATNRLRALARYSYSLFVWTDGSRGSTRVQVCVGESKGRHHESSFKEEGVDCIEALDWLTSSNLYTAIISSFSELQDVLNKPDPNSWVSGHSLISPARNSFSKLMDNLSVLMETVQGKPCECRVYLEKDSLIQRLASGLHRVNAQALEAGFYDRLPSTRNIAILQQEMFEISQRLHTAEVESRLLHLQLEEFKWSFNEVQKEAEKAHRLQEQLNELQHSFSDATEELRRRDQALNHQQKLLEDVEQDRQRLWEALQEAERALQQAAKDKVLIINYMKAVDANLNVVRDQAVASGAAAATLLPSLQLEILSEEAMRGRPEAAAFQHVLISFMGLYSLAAARVEALTIARESLRDHFEPEAAAMPPDAAPDESFWLHFIP
ncbi:coiled-coil domain-containing protein 171-like [Oenanthe melanoleuca]|uniref:coiled-coil domain-containing protein 171-like n=1 Tax=Oenanthe melanoleuca TaxID=2939378 RepID=UPI0024C19EC0|nr:coiled-coil domain-containing protein 171-like [Oenanthe melanoleuca]